MKIRIRKKIYINEEETISKRIDQIPSARKRRLITDPEEIESRDPSEDEIATPDFQRSQLPRPPPASGWTSIVAELRFKDVYKIAIQLVKFHSSAAPFLKKLRHVAPNFPGIKFVIGEIPEKSRTMGWVPGSRMKGALKRAPYTLFINHSHYVPKMRELGLALYNMVTEYNNHPIAKRPRKILRKELKFLTKMVHRLAALKMAHTIVHELRHIYDQERYRLWHLKKTYVVRFNKIYKEDPHNWRGRKEPLAEPSDRPTHPSMSQLGWASSYKTLDDQVMEKYARIAANKFRGVIRTESEDILMKISDFFGYEASSSYDAALPTEYSLRNLRTKIESFLEAELTAEKDFHKNTASWFREIAARNAALDKREKVAASKLPGRDLLAAILRIIPGLSTGLSLGAAAAEISRKTRKISRK